MIARVSANRPRSETAARAKFRDEVILHLALIREE
jgi:hypothetical protein